MGEKSQDGRHEFMRVCMGVPTRIVVYSADQAAATEAAAAAFGRINQLDAMMSDYRRESDLNHLCRRAGGPGMPVSEELYDILEKAERISMESGGGFDVTIGPSVALWRQARISGKMPSQAEVWEARRLVGWEMVKLEPAGKLVRLVKPGMRLDLGSIAKGYAAERAVRVLKERGFDRVMVGLAGDIAVGEAPPGMRGWRIAVVGDRTPNQDEKAGRFVLYLANAAVSTSGDAEQFVEIEGKRYSHIVDPGTGLGMTAVRSVTVVAPLGEDADALATAACVMGKERGKEMLGKRREVAAIFEEGGEREVFDPTGRLRFVEK